MKKKRETGLWRVNNWKPEQTQSLWTLIVNRTKTRGKNLLHPRHTLISHTFHERRDKMLHRRSHRKCSRRNWGRNWRRRRTRRENHQEEGFKSRQRKTSLSFPPSHLPLHLSLFSIPFFIDRIFVYVVVFLLFSTVVSFSTLFSCEEGKTSQKQYPRETHLICFLQRQRREREREKLRFRAKLTKTKREIYLEELESKKVKNSKKTMMNRPLLPSTVILRKDFRWENNYFMTLFSCLSLLWIIMILSADSLVFLQTGRRWAETLQFL